MYSINNSTGQLTALSPATIDASSNTTNVSTLTIGAKSYAYAASAGCIMMYSIDKSSGQLTKLSPPSINIQLGGYISTITIGTNSYAYVTSNNNNYIYMYSIDSNTGQLIALIPASVINPGSNASKIFTITIGNNSYAYVINSTSSRISMHSIDNITGQLNRLSPADISVPGNLDGFSTITIGANSYAYLTVTNGKIFMYSIISGQLIALSPASIDTIGGNSGSPRTICTITIGNNSYAYGCHGSSTNVLSMYSINSSTGQLTNLSPSTVNTGSFMLYISAITIGTNSYVYGPTYSGTIYMYSIDNSSGQLTPLIPGTISGISGTGWMSNIGI